MIFHRTSPAHTSSQTSSGRRRLAAASLIVALAAFGAEGIGGAGVAGATGSQEPAITTTSATFGTQPAGASDVPVTTVPGAEKSSPTTSGRSAEIDAENRRILLIVGALVLVALALVLLTIRYWRATRPVAVGALDSSETPTAVDDDALFSEETPVAAVPSTVDRASRRSRRAVAGADHATADDAWEPRATGEQPRIDPPASGRTVRPSSQQRADALSGNGT